jgi:tRNA-2-methylthio-N6-dimethylallyladenosine synthase
MPRYTLVTFGCQMNQHDSERISELLEIAGYQAVEAAEQADLVLLNTCSVREKADQKLRSEVGRLSQLKRKRPDLTLVVAGCMAQQQGEQLLRSMPDVDLVLGPDNIIELPDLLHQLETGGPPRVRTSFDLDQPQFLPARPEPGKALVSAYVTVMKGCDERCSFCIVPYTRGPERYRPAREIIEEASRLVAAGARELTLLGQTVNSYRDPLRSLPRAPDAERVSWIHTQRARAAEDESEFAALLYAIAERVPGLARLRYTSPHPRHLTRSLIRAHAELAVLAKHVHLPVQSGSDRVLRRMIRRYSVAEYRERVQALRDSVPGVTLSTDVIVGFPGETSEDFAATLELVRAVDYTGLFGFKFSPRPHTPALKLGDDVPEAEKAARLAELFALSDARRQAHLSSLVGATTQVLVEGPGRPGTLSGRSERNEIVHFPGHAACTGRVVPVQIERAFRNSLFGQALDPADSAQPMPTPSSAVRRALPLFDGAG